MDVAEVAIGTATAHAAGEERLQAALGVLRGAGLRRTPRRIAVLRVLIEAGGHLSLNEITERVRRAGPDAGFSTTWRTVLTLLDLGLVHALHAEATPVYGVAGHPHFHAVCQGCGTGAELPADKLAAALGPIEALSGFTMATGSLLATGRCPACA
jgi:Fe2+ or Zn2+ uptake regulation protein